MEFLSALLPVAGPIAAALIAGTISFTITVLAKDQKTSEFRQAWIDGLRSDVSDFVGLAHAMASVAALMERKGGDVEDYLLERHDDFTKMEALSARIRLRLNSIEHFDIIKILDFFRSGEAAGREELDQASTELVRKIQGVLKSEWNRVKRGEFSFRLLKGFSLGVFVFGIVNLVSLMIYKTFYL